MTRILGVDIPSEKRLEASLPYLYGIGPSLARKIIAVCTLDPNKRTKDLTEGEINKLQKEVEKYKIEGDLRREIQANVKRLQEIGSYRGLRHSRNLPVRGQRTKVNARTKSGKRITIGTVRKEIVERTGKTIAVKPTKEGTAS